jgi:hypothetical protein
MVYRQGLTLTTDMSVVARLVSMLEKQIHRSYGSTNTISQELFNKCATNDMGEASSLLELKGGDFVSHVLDLLLTDMSPYNKAYSRRLKKPMRDCFCPSQTSLYSPSHLLASYCYYMLRYHFLLSRELP